MAERSGTPIRSAQPIVIRHLMTTRRPWLRNELTRSLENLPRNTSSSRRGSVTLEKEMDSSVENLFRDLDDRGWKEPPKRRGRSSQSVTLERTQRSRSGNSFSGVGSPNGRVDVGYDSLNDDFLRLDSSDDCFEDASGFHTPRKPSLYVDCSETGHRKFRMDFDAEGFNREDISVTVHPESRLEIHAIREDMDGGRKTTSEFSRRIRLPGDVDVRGLSCSMVDGRIVMEAPLLPQQKPVSTPRPPSSNSFNCSTSSVHGTIPATSPSSPTVSALNVPVVKVQNGVNVLSLCVEVGRVFRSDDVTVKVSNPAKVVVSAERTEVTDCSRMTASLVREFDLPARISSKTLKAGLTEQGLLRITAQLLTDEQKLPERLPV